MAVVLDQFEIEPSSAYESGSYDQVVMGRMLDIKKSGNKYEFFTTFTGSRGVVFGSVNSLQAPTPGMSASDFSVSLSYRSQPYREKAGNTRAAKHICFSERIYDTLTPDPVKCFEINGAYVFYARPGVQAPGYRENITGVSNSSAFMIFDFYMPSTLPQSKGSDLHWTKSFPFEPRYSAQPRKKYQTFEVEAKYEAQLKDNAFIKYQAPRKLSGLFVGTIGPQSVTESARRFPSYLSSGENWSHLWAADVNLSLGPPPRLQFYTTGSMDNTDMMKVLFGYGDSNTTFFSASYVDSNGKPVLMGTTNWPTFRSSSPTYYNTATGLSRYDQITGSCWTVSPIIRGWKYGLHSALPSYTQAYFRQGKFGQYRDMLEQRQYTKLMVNQIDLSPSNVTRPKFNYEKDAAGEPVVTVKFLDEDGNLTKPENTQSQNLSFEVTSSLPYFDLVTRNRSQITAPNLKLVNLRVDQSGKVRV